MLCTRISESCRQQIPAFPTTPLFLAVSGGLDSMVLLQVMRELGRRMPLDCTVVHFNHHLRGTQSDDDERFVARMCRVHNLPLIMGQGRTIRRDRRQLGLSLEDAARQARYAFFFRCLEARPDSWLLTAHTANDQAETVIMNLLRGSGLRGLKGIPTTRQHIARPMLGITREEVERYAREQQVDFVEDRSNASLEFTRNRIRHQVMPVLRAAAGGSHLDRQLATMAAGLADDLAIIDRLVQTFFDRWVAAGGNSLTIDRQQLQQQDCGLIPHILERVIYQAGGKKQLQQRTMATLVNLIMKKNPKTVTLFHLDKSLTMEIHRQSLVFASSVREAMPTAGFSLSIPGPGSYVLPGSRGRLTIKSLERRRVDLQQLASPATDHEFADAADIQFPLLVRSWEAGDFFYPLGMQGKRKKVKIFFTDAKIALDKKKDVPLLCQRDAIIWIVGHRLDNRFAIRPATATCLEMIYEKGASH
ncbi:MAG: tRNA lysidine(34) synthetase TilS [Deltaproteobacteria bacterium]|nr:tRNA lysidine(34) synthetase TilS [Candidatus Anaeroferrophillus wilburensis]MBN2888248.1 tRNA lysidine(34) synthetase TilS [Deltaproteobacteria bacterium]